MKRLHHLAQQTVAHSVIVVDNGSEDGTRDNLRASFPTARVIELGSNLGFPVACNRGAETGRAEVIVLLNNDVEARRLPGETGGPFEDPNVGSTAGLLLRPDERTIDCMSSTSSASGTRRVVGGSSPPSPRAQRVVVGQGDVCWASLPDPTGSGPGFRRPVVVVQGDAFNASRLATVVVVPSTSNLRWASPPGNVLLAAKRTGLPRDSVANVSQIVAVDRALASERARLLRTEKVELVLNGIDLGLGRS